MKARFVIILTLGLSFSPMVSAMGADPITPVTGIKKHTEVDPAAIRCEFSDRVVNKDGSSAPQGSEPKKAGSALEAKG